MLNGYIFFFSFYQYWKNVYWSVPAGDVADLLTASYCGGVAHWPGHPFYTFILKWWSVIMKVFFRYESMFEAKSSQNVFSSLFLMIKHVFLLLRFEASVVFTVLIASIGNVVLFKHLRITSNCEISSIISIFMFV